MAWFAGCATVTEPVPDIQQSEAAETPQETKLRVIREVAAKLRAILPKDHPEVEVRVEGEDVYAVLNTELCKSKYEKVLQRGYAIIMRKPDTIHVNIRVVGPASHKPNYLNAPQEWRGNPATLYIVSYHLQGAPNVYIAMSMAYNPKAAPFIGAENPG